MHILQTLLLVLTIYISFEFNTAFKSLGEVVIKK